MEEKDQILEELNDLLEQKKYKILAAQLQELNEFDIAAYLDELTPEQVLVLFRMLPKDLSADVFSEMGIDNQTRIVESISAAELNDIVENLAMDDAVDMIEELPANLVKKVLQSATADTRKIINQYLKYPDNSAGSIMTAEYIALKKWMSVPQALKYIREHAVDSETIYTCYVTNYQRELEGVVTLKDLVISDPDKGLEELMDDNVISAYTMEDQEMVAQTFNKYDLLALPVVDLENRVVGIITVDDMVDVMEQEATEDIEKMAALSPSEKPYLSTSVFTLAKNRIFWLLFLMISSMLTGHLLTKYEDAFAVVPLLVTFIPMMTGTGGNAGSQSATLVIRGMTVGDIKTGDFLKVWWKEIRVAFLCGVVLAGVNFIRLSLQYPGKTMIILTVVLSMFGTIIIAKSIGCLLPIVAKLIHVDPAIMASPLISTIVDCLSLLLYFQVACVLIGL
ncbi:MAG: magnesium transporter [Eubacterium sp.]|nr:magnesium transporter [Eubacterium sp.]